jgi:tryptophan synthase alpha chain
VALKNGMCVRLLFSQLENIRKSINIPLFLMSYLNPVFQFGLEKFFLKCYETGIDGVILPDAPLDFFQKNIKDLAEKFQIATVLLITPLTSPERIKYIDKISSGFLYVVSSNSITGRSFSFTDSTEHLKRLRDMNLKILY